MIPEFADLTVNKYLSNERKLPSKIRDSYKPNEPPWDTDPLTYERIKSVIKQQNDLFKNCYMNKYVTRTVSNQYQLRYYTTSSQDMSMVVRNLNAINLGNSYHFYYTDDNMTSYSSSSMNIVVDVNRNMNYDLLLKNSIVRKYDIIEGFFDKEYVITEQYYNGSDNNEYPFPWKSEDETYKKILKEVGFKTRDCITLISREEFEYDKHHHHILWRTDEEVSDYLYTLISDYDMSIASPPWREDDDVNDDLFDPSIHLSELI